MSQFKCKFCKRPMNVSIVEYQSNSYCNKCFDERCATLNIPESELNTFEFMGEIMVMSEPKPTYMDYLRNKLK